MIHNLALALLCAAPTVQAAQEELTPWKKHKLEYHEKINLLHTALYQCLIEMNDSFRGDKPKLFNNSSINECLDGVVHFQLLIDDLDNKVDDFQLSPDEVRSWKEKTRLLKQPLGRPLRHICTKMSYARSSRDVIHSTEEICAKTGYPKIPQDLRNPHWCAILRCLRELMTFQHNEETIEEALERDEYKNSDVWKGQGFYKNLCNALISKGVLDPSNPCDRDNNLSIFPGAGAGLVIEEIKKINNEETLLDHYAAGPYSSTGDPTDEPIPYSNHDEATTR